MLCGFIKFVCRLLSVVRMYRLMNSVNLYSSVVSVYVVKCYIVDSVLFVVVVVLSVVIVFWLWKIFLCDD